MTRLLRMLIVTCLLLLPTASQAALTLAFQPQQTYTGAGGGFTIDVDITSTATDPIIGFLVSYVINGPGQFYTTDGISTPDELQLTNPHYVFAGIGTASPGFGGTVTQTTNPFDTYTQNDALADTSSPFVVGAPQNSSQNLLATLHIVPTSPGPVTISIDSTNPGDPNFSFFNGTDFSPTNNVNFVITVSSGGNSIPIPEPSSMLVWGLGALAIVATRRRGRVATA